MAEYTDAIKQIKTESSLSYLKCFNKPCDGKVVVSFKPGTYTVRELRDLKADHLKDEHDIVARSYMKKEA